MTLFLWLWDYLRLSIVALLVALLLLGVPAGICLAVWGAK